MTRTALALFCFVAAGSLAHAQTRSQGQAPSNAGGMAYPEPVPGSGVTRPAPSQARSQGQAPSDAGGMAYPEPVPGSGVTRPGIALQDTGMRAPNFPPGTTGQTRSTQPSGSR